MKIEKSKNFRKIVTIGTIFVLSLSLINFSVISLKIDKQINNNLNENIIDNQQIDFNNNFENRIISIRLISNKTIQTINSFDLDIINVNESFIIVYATDEQIEFLSLKGFETKILYNNYNEMMGFDKNLDRLYSFHDYYELTTELQTIASTYPDITNLYDLGQSVQGRSIWGLKISDNPNIEENEVELRYCGAHHGDEYMSVEIPLLFAWDLVENYTIDPEITDLIDNREIWIIPMVNPDGRQMGQRRNANNVDLNRDYGYMWNGAGSSPSPFSQPETQIIREHALDNNIVLSYSYHTTAEYVNYIWNYKPQPTPDEPWIIMISNVYGDLSGYVPINGFDWYQTTGDTNDFSYGCYGGIDTTIETLNSNIQNEWNRNRDAMYYTLNVSDMGLSGIVTDAITGDPIQATIWIDENYWPVYTDPLIGDYHKPLFEGTYNVHFRANGYEEQIKTITITDANASNILNASLNPSNDYYGYQVTMCKYFSYTSNPSEGISALGPPDNIAASLGNNGVIVIDMGNDSGIIDGIGGDFTIYEADENSEGYMVSVSDNWNGPWSNVGSGWGTSSFDLEDVGLSTARFVKIEDDGVVRDTRDYPGFDLDAIEALNISNSNELPIANFIYEPSNPSASETVYFNSTSFSPVGVIINWSWDFGDGNISYGKNVTHQYVNNGSYFVNHTVIDDNGFNDSILKMVLVGPLNDILFYIGWNLITIPFDNNWYASDLASNITSCNSISRWDAVNQTYYTYIVGGPPTFDFPIMDGHGYFVDVDEQSLLSMVGDNILSVNVPLKVGWNLLGWYNSYNTTASSLSENISGCMSVSMWNASMQTYDTYIVGGPPTFDFNIYRGMGLFVDVTEESVWQGEG